MCVCVDAKVLDANREAREMFQVYTDRKAEILYGCAVLGRDARRAGFS